MANAYARFFASKRKAGLSARQIGRLWRSGKSAPTKRRSTSKRRARRNKRGVPLSGKRFRPSLPAHRGPGVAAKVAKRKYVRAHARLMASMPTRRKRRKGRKGRKARRNSGFSMNRPFTRRTARAAARKRWRGSRRVARRRGRRKGFRNTGRGIISAVKSIFTRPISSATVKLGLGVLAGAVVATGAPSLLPAWNSGWAGLALSVLTAGAAAAVAARVAPSFAASVAAGGLVVVGLRLVGQFAPRALRWNGGAVAGYLPAPGRVAGYLPTPGGRRLAGLGGGGRSMVRAGGESFRSPKFA